MVQKIAEAERNVSSLGAFICGGPHGPLERLACPQRVAGCESGGALLSVSFGTIKLLYALGICLLLRNMAVHPVLALVAVGGLTEADREAMADQNWFPYNYENGKIVLVLEDP